jgi:hypothetical protein
MNARELEWSDREKEKALEEFSKYQSVHCPRDGAACVISFKRRGGGFILKVICPKCNELLLADENTFQNYKAA